MSKQIHILMSHHNITHRVAVESAWTTAKAAEEEKKRLDKNYHGRATFYVEPRELKSRGKK